MRLFTDSTLKRFWSIHPDAEASLKTRMEVIEEVSFSNPNEVIHLFKGADTLWNNRVVFNICGNKYRLIAKIEYQRKLVFVRFLGTHKEYDKIKDIHHI